MIFKPITSAQAKHAVFEQLDLGENSGFQSFGARDDIGLMGLAPFQFQIIYAAVEFEIETAHGCVLPMD
jgi:hypothetical protein